MIEIIVAIIAIAIFIFMIIFQLLIVLGLPLGHLAYGGQHDHKKLPKNLRIMSMVAIGIYLFASIIILERVELIIFFNIPLVSIIAIWILAIYFTSGILMNMISKSKWEKRIMTPIALIIAVCCYLVAILA